MAITSQPLQSTAAPSVRQKLLMRAAFTEVVAANFQVDPKLLKPHVPRGLELDYFRDETYVSLVCMTIRKLGILGIPLTRGFGNLSLRFYVRPTRGNSNRKGVCFIRNYVASPTAAWLLSSRFDADFAKIQMKSNNSGFAGSDEIPEVNYQWRLKDQWCQLRVKSKSEVNNTGPETKVGFMLDHSTQYQSKNGKTFQYLVKRPQWTVWNAAQANFSCDVAQLFGRDFQKPLSRRPASVFVSAGSDVEFYRATQV